MFGNRNVGTREWEERGNSRNMGTIPTIPITVGAAFPPFPYSHHSRIPIFPRKGDLP